MFESALEVISQLQLEASSYPLGVQAWMKLMAISFLLSILFVYSKSGARWVLVAFIANILGLIVGKMLFPEWTRAEIGTHVHLLAWPIILWMIWRPGSRPQIAFSGKGLLSGAYLVWLIWAGSLMLISLILDLRFFSSLVFI